MQTQNNRARLGKLFPLLFAALLLTVMTVLVSSCGMEEYDWHTIPDGSYKIVFYPGEDPIEVTFSNGEPTDNSLFYSGDGFYCRKLYNSEKMDYHDLFGGITGSNVSISYDSRDGWTCGHETNITKVKPGDTLYAEWTPIEYSMVQVIDDEPTRFDNMGDRIFYGEPIYFRQNPVREGYVFDGWFNKDFTVRYTDSDGALFGYDKLSDAYEIKGSSFYMYGRFISEAITLTLDYGDGRTETVTVPRRQAIAEGTLPTETTATAVLTHWSLTPGGEAYDGKPDEDLTLHAVWLGYKDTVFYGGAADGDYKVTLYEGESTTPPIPVRPGYRFDGWFADAACTGTAISTFTYDNLLAGYHPKWTHTSYTATFVAEGYNLSPIVYDYGYGADLPLITKSGYIFEGWCTDAACETTPMFRLSTEMYGDLTLYAKLTPRSFRITMSATDGFAEQSVDVTFGQSYTLAVPTQEGKTFVGWFHANGTQYTDADGKSLGVYENQESVTLYAKFE